MNDSKVRWGHLIRDRVYLVWKNPGEPDSYYTAPAGSEVYWDPQRGTNKGFEDFYGGRYLYWIEIPGYGSIGAEEGVDFDFD